MVAVEVKYLPPQPAQLQCSEAVTGNIRRPEVLGQNTLSPGLRDQGLFSGEESKQHGVMLTSMQLNSLLLK